MGVLFVVTLVLFVVVGVLLTLTVLIQKGRGVGLIFGSGGSSVLGPAPTPLLTKVTAGMFLLFLVLAVALNLMAG